MRPTPRETKEKSGDKEKFSNFSNRSSDRSPLSRRFVGSLRPPPTSPLFLALSLSHPSKHPLRSP